MEILQHLKVLTEYTASHYILNQTKERKEMKGILSKINGKAEYTIEITKFDPILLLIYLLFKSHSINLDDLMEIKKSRKEGKMQFAGVIL